MTASLILAMKASNKFRSHNEDEVACSKVGWN